MGSSSETMSPQWCTRQRVLRSSERYADGLPLSLWHCWVCLPRRYRHVAAKEVPGSMSFEGVCMHVQSVAADVLADS